MVTPMACGFSGAGLCASNVHADNTHAADTTCASNVHTDNTRAADTTCDSNTHADNTHDDNTKRRHDKRFTPLKRQAKG